MSHSETYRATEGMLGNAALPMSEPDPIQTPEQKALILELRLMAEQVESERLRKEASAAKKENRRRVLYAKRGEKRPLQPHRFSFSLSNDAARELEEWMSTAKRTTLKSPPKSVLRFIELLSRRLEERGAKP